MRSAFHATVLGLRLTEAQRLARVLMIFCQCGPVNILIYSIEAFFDVMHMYGLFVFWATC